VKSLIVKNLTLQLGGLFLIKPNVTEGTSLPPMFYPGVPEHNHRACFARAILGDPRVTAVYSPQGGAVKQRTIVDRGTISGRNKERRNKKGRNRESHHKGDNQR